MFGVRSVLVETGGGEFHCPRCRAACTYERQELSNVFVFFFIPFPTSTDEHVVCLECGTSFAPGTEALSGREAVREFETLYDRVLVAALELMTAGKGVKCAQIGREILAQKVHDSNTRLDDDAMPDGALDALLACEPTELPEYSRREIAAAAFACAKRQGFDWDDNERLGDIVDALGLPPGELVG